MFDLTGRSLLGFQPLVAFAVQADSRRLGGSCV